MKRNSNAYYPCSICNWNSPLNVVVTDSKGVSKSLCPIHRTNDEDDKKGAIESKKREQFQDDFRKAFVDIDKTSIGDITV